MTPPKILVGENISKLRDDGWKKKAIFFVTFIFFGSFFQAHNLAILQNKFLLQLATLFFLLFLGLEKLQVGDKGSLHK